MRRIRSAGLCGSCTLTNPVSFEFKGNTGGRASSPFAVTCDPQFIGLPLQFQWVSFNTTFSPCPLRRQVEARRKA